MPLLHQTLSELEPIISQIALEGGTAGLSIGVLQRGVRPWTFHFGDRDASAAGTSPNDETIYPIASLTKGLTSLAIAHLVEAGHLAWTTKLVDIVPRLDARKDEIGSEATVLDLLCHCSGLAAANCLAFQQGQHFLMPKAETVNTCLHLPMVQPFRSGFSYSNWGYGLLTEILEIETDHSYGEFVATTVLEPLELTRTMMGEPPDGEGNTSACHVTLGDGTRHKIPPPGISNDTGRAGSGAARSCIKDLLKLYSSLLRCYKATSDEVAMLTAGIPLTQVATIFEPHVVIGPESSNHAYGMGWVRTVLPAKLDTIAINRLWLGSDAMPVIGECCPGEIVFHNHGSMMGTLSSAYLIPSSETVIVVLTNTMGFADTSDWIGQLILEAILGVRNPHDFVQLTKDTKEALLDQYYDLNEDLEDGRLCRPRSYELGAYAGEYYNLARNFVCSVSVSGRGDGLRMTCQGFEDVAYELEHYDKDTFYWPVDRDEEMRRCIFPLVWGGLHLIEFAGVNGKAEELRWRHDPGLGPEAFTKLEERPEGFKFPGCK